MDTKWCQFWRKWCQGSEKFSRIGHLRILTTYTWLNYYVYQTTPYDIREISDREAVFE